MWLREQSVETLPPSSLYFNCAKVDLTQTLLKGTAPDIGITTQQPPRSSPKFFVTFLLPAGGRQKWIFF